MKKILLFVALATAISLNNSYAQEVQKPVRGERMTRQSAREHNLERAQKTADRMEKELQLNDAQKKNVMALAISSYNEKPSPENSKRFDEEVNKLLTPTQKAIKAQHDAVRIDGMKGQKSGRVASPAPVK